MAEAVDVLTLTQEIAEVSRLSEGDDFTAMLRRYVDRVVRTVGGCDHASITNLNIKLRNLADELIAAHTNGTFEKQLRTYSLN